MKEYPKTVIVSAECVVASTLPKARPTNPTKHLLFRPVNLPHRPGKVASPANAKEHDGQEVATGKCNGLGEGLILTQVTEVSS